MRSEPLVLTAHGLLFTLWLTIGKALTNFAQTKSLIMLQYAVLYYAIICFILQENIPACALHADRHEPLPFTAEHANNAETGLKMLLAKKFMGL
ncbi:MAG: hypothetical protein A3G93_09845 [Nitrospinae bacterium RIFCSPLOWO2_12_FULL_45_22]|nr:MAG: hypothetical protein A3G93_09845 [Nitrospinae bacterium RIFCSPLOWO2_12_FULL_45_22]